MPLPDAYRWSDCSDGSSYLYWNYGFVASIAADGSTKIKLWDKREIHAKAASVAQAKRFVDRWINARNSPRAYECVQRRRRYAKAAAPQSPVKRHKSAFAYHTLLEPRAAALSTRVIKVDTMPDDFESIADVGQSLQVFAKSSGLNVTATSLDARIAQRGPMAAQPRHAPLEQGRRAPTSSARRADRWSQAGLEAFRGYRKEGQGISLCIDDCDPPPLGSRYVLRHVVV